jgi:Flp pilus assembly protein TadG
MRRPRPPRTASSARGTAALWLLLLLPVLLGFAALVVDIGNARLRRAELQVAADAAAWSGAGELNLTQAGMIAAREATALVAAANLAADTPVVLEPSDIEIGAWDPDDSTFTTTTDPQRANAVRVVARRDDLTPFFARAVYETEGLDVGVESIAIRGPYVGAAEVPFYLPFGLPACVFEQHTTDELVDMDFLLNPAGEDNAGWGLVEGPTSTAALADHLDEILPCILQYQEEGVINPACATVSTSDDLDLNNGEHSAALKALADAIGEGALWDEEVWGDLPARHDGSAVDPNLYGHMLAGPLPVFDGGNEYCEGGGGWTETAPIVGFVWAAVYDVRWKGAAAQRNVWIRLNFHHPYDVGTAPGGGPYGVVAAGPPLVVR